MTSEISFNDACEACLIYGSNHVARPHETSQGVKYFIDAGIALLAMPRVKTDYALPFLEGFNESLGFDDYLLDAPLLSPIQLIKFAGQLCYLSFGPNRTKNADASKYFENIYKQGHGSILEHASFSFLLYGVSRSLTHELIRHRAGFAYSQVSQRYVGAETLRFVERPEFQADADLHSSFLARIENIYAEYGEIQGELKQRRPGSRKTLNQAARALLNNETEAPILVTANVRALRHFLSVRGSLHAEPEIRKLAVRLFLCLARNCYTLFADFKVMQDEKEGYYLETPYKKV